MSDHRAEAEQILAVDSRYYSDAQWALVDATRALAHATLAASERLAGPGVITWMAPIEQRYDITTACDGAERHYSLEADDPSAGRTPAADELPEVVVFQGAAVKDYGPVGQLAQSEPFTLRDMHTLKQDLAMEDWANHHGE